MSAPVLIRSRTSNLTHYLAREVPTRFGRRYVAVCGASFHILNYDIWTELPNCNMCKAKGAAA